MAAEILACGDENRRRYTCGPVGDQVIFAVRVLATYVTFYKAEIPAAYWKELEDGLPIHQSVEILRWPAKRGRYTGYNLANPDGRKAVFRALVKIREHLRSE